MKTPKKNGLEFHKQGKQFRWRIRKNGRIIAASSESYTRLHGAEKNIVSLVQFFKDGGLQISSAIAAYKNKKK